MKTQYKLFGIPIWETRSESLGTLAEPSPKLLQALGGSGTSSGVQVNDSSVLTLTAVWRAVNIIAGTMASLPLHIYRKETDGSRIEFSDHYLNDIIKKPNTLMTDFVFRETMVAVLLLWGNSYAVIRRGESDGRVKELIPVHPRNVNPIMHEGKRFYSIYVDGHGYTLPASEMIHYSGLSFDGLTGYSPIAVMRESMGLGLAAQEFGARFFGNGANMDGVIEVPGSLNDTAYERLKSSWREKHQGLKRSHETAILEGDAKYTRIGIPPDDAQFLQTRQFQVSEVARMFGVQPHLLMDLERATHNNIEHQGMEFVMFTLTPWVNRIEAELNGKLLPRDENRKTYLEYNLSGLLRGDAKSRADYYRTMFSIGAMNPNRIRQLENEPAYEGGDQYFAQGAFIPIDDIKNKYKDGNTKE